MMALFLVASAALVLLVGLIALKPTPIARIPSQYCRLTQSQVPIRRTG